MLTRRARSPGARARVSSCPSPGEPYTGWAVGFSSLKIHDEATYAFLADVFGELAEMTPGPYLHLGGDEALGTPPEDFEAFVARVSQIIAGARKTPIAWHEAGAASGLALGTIGQCWSLTVPAEDHAEADAGLRGARRPDHLLPRRRHLPRPQVRRVHADRADVGERSDERRALVLLGPGAYRARHRRTRHPRRRGAAVDRDGREPRRHRPAGLPAHRRRPPRSPGRPRTPRCARGTRSAHGSARSAPCGPRQETGFHRSPEIDWAAGSGADAP